MHETFEIVHITNKTRSTHIHPLSTDIKEQIHEHNGIAIAKQNIRQYTHT